MSEQTETSWGRQPVTVRDLTIFLLILLFVCGGTLTGAWFTLKASSPGVAEGASRPAAQRTAAPATGGVPGAGPAAQGEGQALFEEKCVACHTIGGGKLVGPDLQGVTVRREGAWLSRWLLEPDAMLAEGDPVATQLLQEFNNIPMPNLGLTETEVAALIAYLESGGAPASGQAPAAPAQPALVGDPAVGRGLFTGTMRFENGGPSCMACHSVAGIGALGGGQLGPDLTPAFTKYGGERGLAAFLTNPPLPIMNAVWSQQPLTPQEQADIIAFLQQAPVAGRPIQAIGQLTALAAGGTVILLGLAQLVWRRRLAGVRRPMVARNRSRLSA